MLACLCSFFVHDGEVFFSIISVWNTLSAGGADHMPSGLNSTMASLPNWVPSSCSNSWAVSSHPFTCPLSPTSKVAMQAYLLVAMFSGSLLHFKKKLCLWNARFHLALSFCAPLPCRILPHKLSVLFTITPFFPLRTMYVFSSSRSLHPFLSVDPFVWCSLWHLCHARLWGREGGTGLTIVTGQTHEISIVLFLSRCTVLASNLWWCQAPPFLCPLYDSIEVFGPQHKRQCRTVLAVWLIRHFISSVSTGQVSCDCQQLDQFKWKNNAFCKITCYYCWYDNSFPDYMYC